MRRLICTKPFECLELSAEPGNDIYLCCPGWLPVSAGKVKGNKLTDIWYGNRASEIRKSVIDGTFKYCNANFCRFLDGGKVPKGYENPVKVVGEETFLKYKKAIEEPQKYLPSPKTINLANDKSCNLACPSCRKDIIQNTKKEREENDQLVNHALTEFGDKLKFVYITGSGDPFGSRHFWGLLKSDKLNKFPNLKIKLHTNGILFTSYRWSKLKNIHDKIASIEVSIDGASKNSYEDNRQPAKWEEVIKRMSFISSITKRNPNTKLNLNFVIQANNYKEMKDFVKLGQFWEADAIQFSNLNNWWTYTTREYNRRAIHKPSHPKFNDFINDLKNPIFLDEKIIFDFDIEKFLKTHKNMIKIANV